MWLNPWIVTVYMYKYLETFQCKTNLWSEKGIERLWCGRFPGMLTAADLLNLELTMVYK